MTIFVKRTTLRDMVIKADPEWSKTRRWHKEYEWSNGRIFYANYDDHGIYGEDPAPTLDNPPAEA